MLSVATLALGPFAANCHLVWGPARRALVIDPGAEPEAILERLARRRLEVAAYLLTHGHTDHAGALADLCAARPAPYAMSARDFRWVFTEANQLPPFYPAPPRPPEAPLLLEANQTWNPAPDLACRILATPGHSPGGLCAWFEDDTRLFTGDTLFRESIGRTDIPGGDPAELGQSLQALARLPPATRVYPGHGPATTLAEELRNNPYLTGSHPERKRPEGRA